MEKTGPLATKKKLKWSKGFLNNKREQQYPRHQTKRHAPGFNCIIVKTLQNSREREGTGFTHPGKI
jgi:hypothetical protein